MNNPIFPDGEIPEEILKRLRENTFINFKESFFRATGPIPTEAHFGTAAVEQPDGTWKDGVYGEFGKVHLTGYEENGVFRPITFKYEHQTPFSPEFVKEYEKTEAWEKRRRFINEIVGVAINPVTARKWLEPEYKVGDGETDGTLFNKPAIFRNYIPKDVLCLTFSNGSVSMIKIVEVIYKNPTGRKSGIGLCQECVFMDKEGLCKNINAPRSMLNGFVNYPKWGCGLQEPKPTDNDAIAEAQ